MGIVDGILVLKIFISKLAIVLSEVKNQGSIFQKVIPQLLYFLCLTDKKIILNDISGEFKQFELSMILGQSGSGKTTLLNILSSYETKRCKGTISIDGQRSSAGKIQKNSSYIMQEYKFHHFITVRETMMFTVNCKFYSRASSTMRRFKVSTKDLKK
jgi:ABC-type multidrug transport system ATPase subunit